MNMIARNTAAEPRRDWREFQPPLHSARELTDGGITAQIELDGAVYTLRITRAGKLILTK